MKTICKRILTGLLVCLLALPVCMGHTGIEMIDSRVVTEVAADGSTVRLAKTLARCGIAEIGRPASEGLWTMRVGGRKVFCLNPGKSLHNQDRAKGKKVSAVNYKNQALAKVLTYYFGTNGQKGGTKTYALCQAYAWAAGKGKNKRTAMLQAAAACGASQAYANEVYKAIDATQVYGNVIYYTVDHCKKGGGGSGHQHLIGWEGTKVSQPEYDAVTDTFSGEDNGELRIRVEKKDTVTGGLLDTAKFAVYRDGAQVGTIETRNGVAEYVYTQHYTAEVAPVKAYTYVVNWNALSRAQQEAEKQKGYYSSEVNALSAWQSDMQPRLKAALEAKKQERHQWKIEEIQAPDRHTRHTQAQTQWEEASVKELSYTFYDAPVYMTLQLQKKATKAYGEGISLQGAVYGLYAAEDILATDNRTVAFARGARVCELTTDSQGKAKAARLFPGRYTLQEISAPPGFLLDTKRYEADLTWQGEGASLEQEVTVYEEPIYGRVQIKKTFAGKDVPTQFVTKVQPKADYVPGLCAHHTAHDADCGYAKEQKAQACTHVHTAECYRKQLVCEKAETKGHIHTAECFDTDGVLQCGQKEEPEHSHDASCYEETEACLHSHDAACGYAEYRAEQSCTRVCDICAFEEVMTEEELVIDDAFSLLDVMGKVVDTLQIAPKGEKKGTAVSKELPYGTYTLHQTTSTKQYAKVPDQTITICKQGQILSQELDDKRDETGFFITKTRSISDPETGTMKKEAEEGAEFEIYAPDGRRVRVVKTDKNGIAYSGNLDSYGTGSYTVKQIKGAEDYTILPPQKVEVKLEKTICYAAYDNTYCGSKLRVQKYKEKDKKEPEADAEFTLLDAALVKESPDVLAEKKTAEERTEYILSLKKSCPEAVIGVLTTDAKGQAVQLLDSWIYETHPKGFYVYQTNGEEGYLLAEPVHSAALEQTVENGIHVFSFTATDLWDDWASLTLQKQMTLSENDTVWERGAVFRLVDAAGKTVAEETTDEKGQLCFKKVAFGRYTIEQLVGDKCHQLCKPIEVTLTEKDRHAEVAISARPLVDREKEIRFELTKTSAETGIAVDGARYQLYRILPGADGEDSREEFVANLVTGTERKEEEKDTATGKAVQYLPYGRYVLREVHPADGYTLDETVYTFVLDKNSVSYDADGNGSYALVVTDTPVTGTIAVEKSGQVLVRYEKESQSFVSVKEPLSGAVYGLYAREDIVKDDGSVVHTKGTLIDRKTTDESGYIRFTRKDAAGQATDRFYLGHYYVKELEAPAGYVRDPEEKDIVLDWDTRTDQFDDLRKTEKTDETEEPMGNNAAGTEDGKYVLAEGEKVNRLIREAKTVTFTWESAPQGVKTGNLDSKGGSSIVWWQDGGAYYISTQHAGQVMYLHPDSAHMFALCGKLASIRFKNVDTSRVTDMSYMFYRCSSLRQLDLTAFNTQNTEDMRYMFAYCPALRTIRVNDQKLERHPVYETDIPKEIRAVAKSEFAVGHVYRADDFLYDLYYENGKAEEILPEEGEVDVRPHIAESAGKQTVQLVFTASGRYSAFGQTEAEVVVKDVKGNLEHSLKTPEVTLALTDEQQKITLQLVKAAEGDATHTMLAGAEFTLYAACDLVDRRGQVILQKDDVIQTQTSGGENFSYLEFINLPTEAAKKDKAAPYMYYIRETKAPDGYEKDDRTVYCTGKAGADTVLEMVYGCPENRATEEGVAYTDSADWLFTNRKSQKLVLKKEWIADSTGDHPETLDVTVTLPDGTKRSFTLKAEDGWMLRTDIDVGVFDGYSAAEIRTWFTEQLPEHIQKLYEETGSAWDPATGVYTFRNRSRQPVSSTVTKVWEDGEDQEGLRPETITAELYQNEQVIRRVTLPYNGSWTYTEKNLPAADSEGNTYRYSWKELENGLIGQDAVKGYLATAAQEENSADTVLTNYHALDTRKLSVEKLWDDSDDAQKIRPEKVRVQLLANDKPVQIKDTEDGYIWAEKAGKDTTDTLILTAENHWRASVDGLPVADESGDITYRWQELANGELWITGESTIGYAASYDTDKRDPDKTLITNTHTYTAGGSVKVTKKILARWFSTAVTDPVFIFTLEGKDVYGRAYMQKKELKFTEADRKTVDAEGYIVKTVQFEQVPYGTYTVTESGMEGIYDAVQCIPGEHATLIQAEKNRCTVQIGPTLQEVKEPQFALEQLYLAEVTFENAAVRGSITVTKYREDKNGVLPGVTFTLQNKETQETTKKTTDKNGQIVFDDLMPGSYTVTEVKTKDGYSLLKEPVEITLPYQLTDEEAREQQADTKKAVQYDGDWYFYALSLDVTDEAVLRLPMTGGKTGVVYLGAMFGGICLGVGFYTGRKRRRDRKNRKGGDTEL